MDKEIEKLAEKEYPINDWSDEATVYNREQVNKRIGFIKGYQKAQEDEPQKDFLTWYTTGNNKHYSGDKLIEKYKKEVLNQ